MNFLNLAFKSVEFSSYFDCWNYCVSQAFDKSPAGRFLNKPCLSGDKSINGPLEIKQHVLHSEMEYIEYASFVEIYGLKFA